MPKWGLLGCVALLCTLAACSLSGDEERKVDVGVWEYFIRDADPATADQKMADLTAAGFRAAITNSFWEPGRREPSRARARRAHQRRRRRREAANVRPLLIVQSPGSGTTPNTAERRAEFAAYAASIARRLPAFRDFIVGNEPNLNRFWLPQFGPDGENVAARDYLALLAETYDALKAVSTGHPRHRRRDRAARRRRSRVVSPDALAHDVHPRSRPLLPGERPRDAGDGRLRAPPLPRAAPSSRPDFAHPNSTTIALADYDKLVELLEEAFDGTAQEGGDLPILYTEFGVQTEIPEEKRDVYTNLESPVANDAVPESTQEEYYRQAFELVCDQENVEGLYIFHVWDEPDLLGWQSGLYYADRTPKSSRDALVALPSCS